MAKKKSKATTKKAASKRAPKPGNKRYRRTDEELIRDLQQRIQDVKARQKARDVQKSPSIKAASSTLKAIDRALSVAESEEDNTMRRVLADARKPIAAHLEKIGVKVPKVKLPRGRRPKGLE